MRKIIMITGGQRSGKSTEAERLALSLSANPVYMATAHIWDDEFRERVRIHQERRGKEWTNIEEEMQLSRHDVKGRVVLIDCCTLWATNFFFQNQDAASQTSEANGVAEEQSAQSLPEVSGALSSLREEFDRFTSQDATFIFVTNEIGLGGVSANAVQRRFTDLLGWFNQYVASKADEVYLMVSGIRVKIKG
ncbi:MAG: bifunctional adenosylcobinamide kinase/adenosylcobinamide-phosphate guanylyltransferase [Bacteroidaceae bacterium]|nr:bifunctional adenosylcobinamide kinase/adenosylcobinamide-phosphate guanylyltransferase [Bacteroidaceae bacterium]